MNVEGRNLIYRCVTSRVVLLYCFHEKIKPLNHTSWKAEIPTIRQISPADFFCSRNHAKNPSIDFHHLFFLFSFFIVFVVCWKAISVNNRLFSKYVKWFIKKRFALCSFSNFIFSFGRKKNFLCHSSRRERMHRWKGWGKVVVYKV